MIAVLLAASSAIAAPSALPVRPIDGPPIEDHPIDARAARRAFEEARLACEEEAGALWGRDLFGPLLFVDAESLAVTASRADAEGLLEELDGVWIGTLPTGTIAANTAFAWGGVEWAMLRWPLPETIVERRTLLMHELWHRVQDELGLSVPEAPNEHLLEADARALLFLEWRALAAALSAEAAAQGDPRGAAIGDALVFRARRHELFPGAHDGECGLEIHEGLAEYTGWATRGTPDEETRAALARHLELAAAPGGGASLSRSFAYRSGAAYGVLLDASGRSWRAGLGRGADLGRLLGMASQLTLPADLAREVEARGARYGAAEVFAIERRAAEAMAQRRREFLALLVEGPLLDLPLVHPSIGFDPGAVMPLGEHGTAYAGMVTLSDDWGTLASRQAVLVSWERMRAFVVAPDVVALGGRSLSGETWTLELAPGWNAIAAARAGDWHLQGP